MTVTRPRAERGAFPPGTEHYGRSLLGAPLIWFPAPAANRESGLILAGTHGDETSSVVTLSCALRTLNPTLRRHHVVLAVNPDGCQLGLRANANGIDLNRLSGIATIKLGQDRTFETTGNVIQRTFHRILADCHRRGIVVRQQDVLRTQLIPFQDRQTVSVAERPVRRQNAPRTVRSTA